MKMICKAIKMMIVSMMMLTLFGCSSQNAKIEDLEKTTTDSFNNINLNVDVAKIDIIPSSDEFAIEYHIVNQNVDYSIKNETLELSAKAGKKASVNKIDISYIKIYVPEDSEFTNINYKGDVGSIHIKCIKVDDMKIITDVGNVALVDIYVNDKLSIKTDVGNIDAALTNADCSYDIRTDIAKISINGKEFSGVEVNKKNNSTHGPKVKLITDTGNINFEYKSSK